MRILFLGNSFTYYHDMVAELLHAEVSRNLRGGAYLYQHQELADELCAITHQLLTERYHTAAQDNNALLAPVGQAFAAARHSRQLYDADHLHPAPAGSRLAAETIAAVIRSDLDTSG